MRYLGEISTSNLGKRYEVAKNCRDILQNVNQRFTQNQFTVVIGPSGCGKSTLLHLLAGIDTPTSGEVSWNKTPLSSLNQDQLAQLRAEMIGLAFQEHHLISELTIKENILLPQSLTSPHTIDHEYIDHLIKVTGIENISESSAAQVSGGEAQRASLARALAHRPAFLLADEPTGNLDPQTADHVYQLLHKLHAEENIGMIIATHDPRLVSRADRVVEIMDGSLA